MAAYLAKVKKELSEFEYGLVEQIPREQNANADALARLATSKEAETLSIVPVEFLESPSVAEKVIEVEMIDTRATWMTPIVEYLTTGRLPEQTKGCEKNILSSSEVCDSGWYIILTWSFTASPMVCSA